MRARIAACSLAMLLAGVIPANAQMEAFVRAVRDFGSRATSATPENTQSSIDRMASSLAEWDRQIADREKSVQRDLRQASRESAFQLHVELGLAYAQRGRTTDALREFNAAVEVRPAASDVHVLRGLTFEAAADRDQAARAFREAWARDRQNPIKAYFALRDWTGPGHEGPWQTL